MVTQAAVLFVRNLLSVGILCLIKGKNAIMATNLVVAPTASLTLDSSVVLLQVFLQFVGFVVMELLNPEKNAITKTVLVVLSSAKSMWVFSAEESLLLVLGETQFVVTI